MTREKKLRRVVLVCCHFVRNLAYYRAGWKDGVSRSRDDFWITVNGNFLDICVLEWCKLFGEQKDRHHWKSVMGDSSNFRKEMFSDLGINQTKLDREWGSIRSYRDKFVAHLDEEETMKIPQFDIALKTVIFYHAKVVAECNGSNTLHGLPADLNAYYQTSWDEAEKYYASVKQ